MGDFIAMSLSLAGLGALVLASATLFTVLKWVGAIYLVWLGIKLLRSAPSAALPITAQTVEARSVFAHAALVTALNVLDPAPPPKGGLMLKPEPKGVACVFWLKTPKGLGAGTGSVMLADLPNTN